MRPCRAFLPCLDGGFSALTHTPPPKHGRRQERALHCFQRVAVAGKEDVGQSYGVAATLTPYSCREEVIDLLVKVGRGIQTHHMSKPSGRIRPDQSLGSNLTRTYIQVRQEAAKVTGKGPAEGNEEAVEDAFAAEINTRVVRFLAGRGEIPSALVV